MGAADEEALKVWSKLSRTAKNALIVIDGSTIWDDGIIRRYWIPSDRHVYTQDVDGSSLDVFVFGSGFVSALKGLTNKGLTRAMKNAHSYAITEHGRCVIEAARSASATAQGRERTALEHDGTVIEPACVQGMGCLCAAHAQGRSVYEDCDATEEQPSARKISIELTPDELMLLVGALDSHAYWQLSAEDNRNNGAVIDDDANDELKECKALHDRLEYLYATNGHEG